MTSRPRPSPDGTTKEVEVVDQRIAIFVSEYVANGGNGTAAALKAGVPEKSAAVWASGAIRRHKVSELVEKALRAQIKRIDARGDLVLIELFRILNVNVKDIFTPEGAMKHVHDLSDDLGRAISSIEVEEIWEWEGEGRDKKKVQVGELKKVKFWSKTESANLLGKHLKLWIESAGLDVNIFTTDGDVELVLDIKT